jgi:putative endonuclease
MWFVYLLRCSDDTLYCGISNNLDKRIKTHNNGKGAKYTKSRLPVILFYYETVLNKSEALKREYQIKKLSKSEKISLKEKNSPK